jgi:hypothetical protein
MDHIGDGGENSQSSGLEARMWIPRQRPAQVREELSSERKMMLTATFDPFTRDFPAPQHGHKLSKRLPLGTLIKDQMSSKLLDALKKERDCKA